MEKLVSLRFCHCTEMKFSIKDFFSKCDQIADFVPFTEEILNENLIFLCNVLCDSKSQTNIFLSDK